MRPTMKHPRFGPWIRLNGHSRRLFDLSLEEIFANRSVLKSRGFYERALLDSFVRTNHAHWALSELRELFESADRKALRAAGDPLPGPGPFTVYRGVSGEEPEERRIRGLSWTTSLKRAHEFAERFDGPDPAVYEAVIEAQHVLTYINWNEEEEFIVLLPPEVYLRRVE